MVQPLYRFQICKGPIPVFETADLLISSIIKKAIHVPPFQKRQNPFKKNTA